MVAEDSAQILRQQVRAWLQANVPVGWRQAMTNSEQAAFVQLQRQWFGKLSAAGYATPHWPSEWPGGAAHRIAPHLLIPFKLTENLVLDGLIRFAVMHPSN